MRCCSRSWSRAACAAARTSTSRCRPSASTRAAPTTRCAPRRRSWAASPTPAATGRSSSTAPASSTLVPVSSCDAAELTKLLENIFRSVNIALVNELAMLCHRMGLNVWEVVDAGRDQALRLHAVLARAGPGRPLPSDRPVLPVVEGARVRLPGRVHRARRQGQPEHALPLRRARRPGAERRPEAGERELRRDPRRRLQGRSRRPARVAGAQGDGAPRRRRAPGSPTTIPSSPAWPSTASTWSPSRSPTSSWPGPTSSPW